MPLKQKALKLARKLGCLSSREPEDEVGPVAIQPGVEPDEPQDTEPARPYQAFVENEAREYWQDTGKEHNLTKPGQAEIREAAMPVLCQALRNRTGHRRHYAVAGMVQHAYENGFIRRPFPEAAESPSYIDALIQLADDANWLAREIPLPGHPPPRHPRIYYTIGSRLGRPVPVPRQDALIRGCYLYKTDGTRVTEEKYINPIPNLPGGASRNTICSPRIPLNLPVSNDIDRLSLDNISSIYYGLAFERARKPTNLRGVYIWLDWKETSGAELSYFSCILRDLPYKRHFHFSPHPPDMDAGPVDFQPY